MKNDQEEAYEKALSSTLARVIEFVKFAEAKNAALLTFSSAWILASVNLVHGANPISDPDWVFAFKCALPLFIVAAVISILTFLPNLDLDGHHKDPEKYKSLLYFGDAARFDPAAYKQRLEKRYKPQEPHWATQSYLDDLAVQIHINSCIAVKKFKYFNFGATAVLVAIVAMLYPLLKSLLISFARSV